MKHVFHHKHHIPRAGSPTKKKGARGASSSELSPHDCDPELSVAHQQEAMIRARAKYKESGTSVKKRSTRLAKKLALGKLGRLLDIDENELKSQTLQGFTLATVHNVPASCLLRQADGSVGFFVFTDSSGEDGATDPAIEQRFDREDDVFERIYKKWFALDGVYFDRGHVALLAEKTTPVFYTESRSRVPYTPWFPTHYIYVGTKTK